MSSNRFVPIGRVGKPHGLDGSFAVEEASNAAERFAVGATVYLEGEPARILSSKRARGRPVIKLDRPAARGAQLEIPRAELPPPDPDSFYVFDLVIYRGKNLLQLPLEITRESLEKALSNVSSRSSATISPSTSVSR